MGLEGPFRSEIASVCGWLLRSGLCGVGLDLNSRLLGASAMRRSEVLAEESIVCLQKALNHLREIWELIGIPEDQRLQRAEVVKKHIKELLDMMIAEEESLKERLIKSISVCQKELNTLCTELRVEPFQVRGAHRVCRETAGPEI
ncbi:protein regulator of cytokinesis 1-like [Sapajus apella]|uniref:Protein regulator of cytokinesis 1-like n=1 Tax=Sapajus apella TaxID=9515 RepID=A0A6J3HGP4_SAPAP|nr:protein regulator of cytokinesis 1-like [Sapajus apella]XP_032128899.1 protein regulator of cytokinesis 1-like [Sapajus apella]